MSKNSMKQRRLKKSIFKLFFRFQGVHVLAPLKFDILKIGDDCKQTRSSDIYRNLTKMQFIELNFVLIFDNYIRRAESILICRLPVLIIQLPMKLVLFFP